MYMYMIVCVWFQIKERQGSFVDFKGGWRNHNYRCWMLIQIRYDSLGKGGGQGSGAWWFWGCPPEMNHSVWVVTWQLCVSDPCYFRRGTSLSWLELPLVWQWVLPGNISPAVYIVGLFSTPDLQVVLMVCEYMYLNFRLTNEGWVLTTLTIENAWFISLIEIPLLCPCIYRILQIFLTFFGISDWPMRDEYLRCWCNHSCFSLVGYHIQMYQLSNNLYGI